MKAKKLTVENKQSLAFDNHQVTLNGDGVKAIIQFSSVAEFNALSVGDQFTIEPVKTVKKK